MHTHHLAHDLLLLMLNLAQLNSQEHILNIFLEAMNSRLQPQVTLRLLSSDEVGPAETMEIATAQRSFGRIVLAGDLSSQSLDLPALIRNAVRMLAIILENRTQAKLLADRNLQLEEAIKERTATLRESEERYRRLFEDAMLGIFRATPAGEFIAVNPAYARMFGYESAEALLAANITAAGLYANPQHRPEIIRLIMESQTPTSVEIQYRRQDGSTFTGNLHAWPVADTRDGQVYLEGIVEDITERKRLETQLLESHKMESIGRLAGGIAHDFNNLLTVIISYSDLAITALPPGNPVGKDIQQIQNAAVRAATLTRQLLAFARRQIIEPKIVNLNDLILNIDKMLRRIIGEDIELVVLPADQPGLVKIDPAQFEQVLVNLAANARDAMPTGGKFILRTANVSLEHDHPDYDTEVIPGNYVLLTAGDTGKGMSQEVLAHLFEPFFTTKEVGKGTGLGLATCHGIVKQNGGHIRVYSEADRGATFKIYLPKVDIPTPATVEAEAEAEARSALVGSEAILVVEDEPLIREMIARILAEQGYTVRTAATGSEALQIVPYLRQIDLLITDVVMPQMSGPALAGQLRAQRPELKVLYISGYTNDPLVNHSHADPEVTFLAKPFTPETLARKVREVLDL